MTDIQQKLDQINLNYQKIDDLQTTNDKLYLELSKLISEEIKSSKLLENSIWEVQFDNYSPLSSISITNTDLNIFKIIQQYKSKFHEFMLANLHIDLYNSANQTSLLVSEIPDLYKFVSDFKVKLTTSNLDNLLNNNYHQIQDLEKLKHIISTL